MTLRQFDLTTALRPSLLPEEILLFVQDAVGLYRDKWKIEAHQNGHAYLTSHRICYVDNDEPRKQSVAIDLKDIERPEFYVSLRLTKLYMPTKWIIGWFPQVLPQDHTLSEGLETILAGHPESYTWSRR